nr:CocE/NonD family hydrolase [Kibdelosporangium phytohabitans]
MTCPVPGADLALTVVEAAAPGPVVLIRTPYGRQNHFAEAEGWARRGFPCVIGDVRGRFGSTGDFEPYRHEEADGAAVVDWIVRQPFCDGQVLPVGGSYAAHCAITAALARQDKVRGVIAAVPALGLGATIREPGGAARLACRVGWWSEHGDTRLPRAPRDTRELAKRVPVSDIHPKSPGWQRLWTAPRRDSALWNEMKDTRLPLLAVGGLADPFAADTVDLARTWGGPARLLMGPWGHELDTRQALGHKIGKAYLDWVHALDRLRGHKELIAVTDEGDWRVMTAPQTRFELAVERAGFVADPDRPYPDHRGHNYAILRTSLPQGEIHGPLTVELNAKADCADADWFAHGWLDDTYLGHGVRRIRDGATKFTVDCPPAGAKATANAVLTIEISGHNWPRHARNPHTGQDPFTATELLPSTRTVLAATAVLPWAPEGADAVRAEEIAA